MEATDFVLLEVFIRSWTELKIHDCFGWYVVVCNLCLFIVFGAKVEVGIFGTLEVECAGANAGVK